MHPNISTRITQGVSVVNRKQHAMCMLNTFYVQKEMAKQTNVRTEVVIRALSISATMPQILLPSGLDSNTLRSPVIPGLSLLSGRSNESDNKMILDIN